MKGNKGITLIALVITIIVLLILAGVSIAMLSGDNSILGRSREAGKASSISSAKEQIALAINEGITEYDAKVYADNTTADMYSIIKTKLDAAIQRINADSSVTAAKTADVSKTVDGTVTITYKGDGSVVTGTLAKETAALTWATN